MKQTFVATPTPLLENGKLKTAGFSTHMNFIYDGKTVKSRRLKEWDFYQILFGDYVLQFTMGHVSYAAQVSVTLFNIKNGFRATVCRTKLGSGKLRKKMPNSPEKPSVLQWFDSQVKAQFEVTPRYRRLTLSQFCKNDVRAEIDVTLTNSSFSKEKMVIATPFQEGEWYLNCKENCFVANGYCRIDSVELEIKDGNAVLDWGRGVWPRKHSWVWGNGSTTVDGKPFGFNIGWGFGDTSQATENMFFFNNKAYKLGSVAEGKTSEGYKYFDDEKTFVFHVKPLYDNYTHTKAFGVNNTCHQIFGVWSGEVTFPDKTKMKIPPFVAFCEHADNKW